MSLKGRTRYIFAILASLFLAGAFITYRSLHPANNIPYTLAKVKKGALVQKILATGTINSEVTVQIGSQVSGTVEEIYVDNNSPIKRGQLLALIDPDAFQAQLAQAVAGFDTTKANLARQEANLLYSKALLEKADVQLNEAETNHNRMRELFKVGVISKSQLESTENSFSSAWAEKKAQEALYSAELQSLKAAEAQIAQSNSAVALAKVNLSRAEIRSPIDGIVISRNVDIGQTVAASFQSPILFVITKDLSRMEITTNVSEADIGNVKTSKEMTFRVDAYPDRIFMAKVKENYMAPTIVQNAVYYSVVASVDNREMFLRPGMRADVWIETVHKENVLLIPSGLVKEKGDIKYVEVWERGKVKQKEVKTGLKGTDGVIEILSGLDESDNLIVSRVKT